MRVSILVVLTSILVTGCVGIKSTAGEIEPNLLTNSNVSVVSVSEVEWEQLNPARGDQSPQAGTLWGDRKGKVPTGFLAKFVDGFSSPPHIHNATYRAVVIRGLIHNDDPNAAHMWMPAGSFWTQPRGEVHITAARGISNVALVEIDQGPYLVMSPEEAFDNGERPVNIDAANLIWVDAPGLETSATGVKVAYLWGNLHDGQANGTFLNLPAGYSGMLHSYGSIFRGVVITGQLQYEATQTKTLDPGSYISSEGEAVHQIKSAVGAECIIYVRTDGEYKMKSSI